MLSTLKRIFLDIRQKVIWSLAVKKEKKITTTITASTSFKNGLKVILIPHADDELIGCYSILKRYDEVLLYNMDMQGGDSNIMHQIRRDELTKIANHFHRDIILSDNSQAKHLASVIKEMQPDFIFLPFFVDWHEEHIAVMATLRKAIEVSGYSNKIVMYQVSLPICPEYINHFELLSKQESKKKWALFREIYESQKNIPSLRFSAHEKINGSLYSSETYAAEVFCEMIATEWNAAYEKLILSETQRVEARANINNINYIRSYTHMIAVNANEK